MVGLLGVCALAGLVASCGSSGPTTIATPGSTGFTPAGSTPGSEPGSAAPGSSAPGTTTVPGGPVGPPTLNAQSTISTVGLDKVNFGMTLDEARKAAGTELVVDGAGNPACELVRPQSGPDGVAFLISDGRVERVDLTKPPIGTRSGAKVGSTADQVKALYPGQIQEQPRTDGQPGTQLVFVPKDAADAKFRIIFLTDGTTVQSFRAGRLPQVAATTGCG
jgi:hypothetical protein